MYSEEFIHPDNPGVSTVDIVGLSDKPDRPSHQVASYLQDHGFLIIPVNPAIAEVFGIQSYPSISAIPATVPSDIMDIFRRPEHVVPVIREIIQSGRKPIVWMQEGVISEEGKHLAEENGLQVVMGLCIMKTRMRQPLPDSFSHR